MEILLIQGYVRSLQIITKSLFGWLIKVRDRVGNYYTYTYDKK